MHQRSLSELRGAPWRGSGRRWSCPPRGAPLWAWLLLGALAAPGARSFLSEEQEELLVELHNHYRGQVSPSASAMMPLRWDPSLKVIAEGYAAKCVWNHNPELEDTGENLFAGSGSLDLREALEKWFLEHLDYDFQNNSCDEDKMCGHYTQMVWADTHRVGCAFHLCDSMEGLGWERASFLVCNYYPAGNYEGERPFVEGERCSRCPENLQKCENNLCVADTVEEDDDGDEEEVDEEEELVVPPEGTSGQSLQAKEEEEEEEEEAIVPPAGTSGPSFQAKEEEEEEEEELVDPPAGTSGPSLQAKEEEEEEEEEAIVPPAGTSGPSFQAKEEEEEEEEELVDPHLQPATITASASTPSITTTAEEDPEDPSTPQGEEEKEEKKKEEKMEDEKRKERREKPAEKEKDVPRFIYNKNSGASATAGSPCSPSLLLAGLTGILSLTL
ncbi:peptidase inhibitor 16 [Clinocottus analis]|uniref:peptidase inhibitor 16 n=1 Tax=Clinocottus analis TaxID=304258 RepID=UPI0035C22680